MHRDLQTCQTEQSYLCMQRQLMPDCLENIEYSNQRLDKEGLGKLKSFSPFTIQVVVTH